jgi:hypothetical protein
MENNRTLLQLAALLYDLVPWYAASQDKAFATDHNQREAAVQAMLARFTPVFSALGVDVQLLQTLLIGKEDAHGLATMLKTAHGLASDGESKQQDGLLRPILEVLGQNGKFGTGQAHAFQPKALTIDKNVFPEKLGQVDEKAIGQLWKGFEVELLQLPRQSLSHFVESLAYLLQKHAAFIPANGIKGNIVQQPRGWPKRPLGRL